MKHYSYTYTGGQAMITAVVFFLMLALTTLFGIATPILKQAKVSADLIKSKQSYYLAEGGLEDALYRVKNGMDIVSGETVVVDGYTTTLSLTTTQSGKTIDAVTDRNGIVRKMQAKVTTGSGTAFNYGIQAGNGGFVMDGGSQVNGNVYANGPVNAQNGSVITGSAVAADSSALVADQNNSTPTTPPNSITFRSISANQDFAQSFKVTTDSPLNKIELYIRKNGSPADATVRIVTDNNGSPSTTNVLSPVGTLAAAQVSSTFGWTTVVFASNPILDPGTTYWIVIDNGSQNTSQYYQIAANSTYANGQAKVGTYSGSWTATSPAGLDGYFKLYLGGVSSYIGGDTYAAGVTIGTAGVGDAWANRITGATVAGTMYCQTSSITNKTCNTTRPNPSPQGFPVSDANIQEWKDSAEAGWTYNGNLSIGSAGTTTGPLVVNGNLNIGSGGIFTMTGTIWVKGTITVSGGASVRVAAGSGEDSVMMISDGYMSFSGGIFFQGSGQTGSYPLLITTSDCPASVSCAGRNAIELNGGSGAIVLNAQSGTLKMAGGTSARSLVAQTVVLTGGAEVTYETGLADLTFTLGPSGGWNITSWQEVQ